MGAGIRRLQLAAKPSARSADAIGAAARGIISSIEDASHILDYLRHHQARLALDYEWMQQSCHKSQKICELGAWPFFLTRALLDSGFDVAAVNLPLPYDLSIAQAARVSVADCDIETQPLPFADCSFDHVLLNEVFEHLRIDLVFTMKEALRILRPQGMLWLSTPNLRSIRGIMNFIWKAEAWSISGEGLYHQYSKAGSGVMGHVREYTAREVTDFLAAVGYSVERVIYRGVYSNPGARLTCLLVPSMKPYFSILARRM